jgi:hypothetical protein
LKSSCDANNLTKEQWRGPQPGVTLTLATFLVLFVIADGLARTASRAHTISR